MTRTSLLWIALFAIGCATAINAEYYSHDLKVHSGSAMREPNSRTSLSQLIADANAEDATIRAAAIDALALAPKSRAAPVLQALLSAATREDRELALNSLYTLALNQGDDDGAIRAVFRRTIYDGDDGELAVNAQLALDDLERDLGHIHSTARL